MKVYNDSDKKELSKNLKKTLKYFRDKKNFNPEKYINSKLFVFKNYLEKFHIKSCVVAISGGIDSAVVLGLVNELKKRYPCVIESIYPICMPAFKSEGGVVNQESATSRGEKMIEQLGLKPYVVDLSSGFLKLKNEVDSKISIEGKSWANGQFIPYLRTASLYYVTALNSQEKSRSILVGTTNRDEGLYLGYFGKASDGMVDVQLISDLHKSEVYAIAKYLNLAQEVIDIVPTGDMYDNRSDEDVFGASYDFVELFLNFKCLSSAVSDKIMHEWSQDDKDQYEYLSKNLENMHSYNKHKYIGCSPSVHLDIDYMNIKGAWKNNVTINYLINNESKEYSKINGLFVYEPVINCSLDSSLISSNSLYNQINIFSKQEAEKLSFEILSHNGVDAGYSGYKELGNGIGSIRRSFFNKSLAEIIKLKIEKFVDKYIEKNGEIFYFGGVSDLFRSIEYKENGGLYPHYDHSFVYNSNKLTLKSLIIYLTPVNSKMGGRTRFVKDNLHNMEDWDRFPLNDEIDFQVDCEIGDCIIFDHHNLHDSELINRNKHIIRTDLIYIKNEI